MFKHTDYQLEVFVFFSPTRPTTVESDPITLIFTGNP